MPYPSAALYPSDGYTVEPGCAIPELLGTTYTVGSWSASDVGSGFLDSAGNHWSVTNEQGLMHTPAFRTNVVDREQSDGVFDGDAWLPGRSITLEGAVRSPDFPTLYAAMRSVRSLLVAGDRRQPLVVAYPDVTIQAIVRKDGECLIDKTVSRHPSATFSLLLYAPDPALYGSTLQSAATGVFIASGGRAYPDAYNDAYGAAGTTGIVDVVNNGNMLTYPLITISAGSGPLVNPTVTIFGGLSLVFALTMNAGDTLTIDTQARTVLLNGTGARQWPTTSGTLACPAGSTPLLFTAASSAVDASLSAQWRDAYQ